MRLEGGEGNECRFQRSDYTLSEEAEYKAYTNIRTLYENKDDHFANAREIRNMFENVISNQADRLFGISNPSQCGSEM